PARAAKLEVYIYIYDTFDVASVFLPDGRENAASKRRCGGVEVVEEGGDAAGVGLVHDRPGAAGGGDHVEAADALLDARDVARRHRQVAQPEAEQQSGKARLPGHLAADADRHAAARGRLDGELDQPQDCRM